MPVFFPGVIRDVTAKDCCFRQTVKRFQKSNLANKLKVVRKILSALLHHPSLNVREVANFSLRHDKKGVFSQPTLDSIADACRVKIEMQGNPHGLKLMAEPVKTGVLSNGEYILLKGKFNNKQSVYCKFPSPPRSIHEWESGENLQEGMNSLMKQDIKLLKHLQQKSDCENIITLLAYATDVNVRLTYYLFSCNELDMSVSEYLVRSVTHGNEVLLQERVGLAIDVLSAVEFCNQHNILIRHICAHAFLLTRKRRQVVAKLANFSQAQIVTENNCSLKYYGRWPCTMKFDYVCISSDNYQ